MFQAFLNDIARKLVVAQLNNFSFDAFNDFIFVFLTFSMLKNMLNNIIAKLIFGKRMNLCQNLI